ncbi:hypothetical protein Peur_024925 [Populus x canadensis]
MASAIFIPPRRLLLKRGLQVGIDRYCAGGRYLGIRFERIPVYSAWAANRDIPVPDSSGALTIGNDGKLKITYQGGPPIAINSNVESPKSSSDNITATLLDSGNLDIRQVDSDGKPAEPVLCRVSIIHIK